MSKLTTRNNQNNGTFEKTGSIKLTGNGIIRNIGSDVKTGNIKNIKIVENDENKI